MHFLGQEEPDPVRGLVLGEFRPDDVGDDGQRRPEPGKVPSVEVVTDNGRTRKVPAVLGADEVDDCHGGDGRTGQETSPGARAV